MCGALVATHTVVYEMISSSKDQQRQLILESARHIIMTNPNSKIKAHEVAERAQIARTSLYEHFSSMNELMGELLLTELIDFRSEVALGLGSITDVTEAATQWVDVNLNYFHEGRHALVRALTPVAMNSTWKNEIRAQHIKLYEELKVCLAAIGFELSPLRFEFISAVLETAARRIEISDQPQTVRKEAIDFILKALN